MWLVYDIRLLVLYDTLVISLWPFYVFVFGWHILTTRGLNTLWPEVFYLGLRHSSYLSYWDVYHCSYHLASLSMHKYMKCSCQTFKLSKQILWIISCKITLMCILRIINVPLKYFDENHFLFLQEFASRIIRPSKSQHYNTQILQ